MIVDLDRERRKRAAPAAAAPRRGCARLRRVECDLRPLVASECERCARGDGRCLMETIATVLRAPREDG